MNLLSKLTASFTNDSDQESQKHLLLFQLGNEMDILERRRKELYEKLGEEVYYQRQDEADSRKEQIRQIDQEIFAYTKRLEELSNEL